MVNSVLVDCWKAELAIIASNDEGLKFRYSCEKNGKSLLYLQISFDPATKIMSTGTIK